MDRPGERIIAIQALRIVAAWLAAWPHACLLAHLLGRRVGVDLPALPGAALGRSGVDAFFVISGFVMVHSSWRLYGRPGARRTFLLRRIVRIVPMYWLATGALLAWSLRTHEPPWDGPTLATSFLFIPYPALGNHGVVIPFLVSGWTLNYEMLFYGLFALALAGSALATSVRVGALLSGAVAVGALVSLPLPFGVWARPITLEFVASMAIALIHRRGIVLPGWARIGLVAAALGLACALAPDGAPDAVGWPRLAGFGVPGALLVAAATLGPLDPAGAEWWNHGGNISFALYLWNWPLMLVAYREGTRMMLIAQRHRVFGAHSGYGTMAELGVAAAMMVAATGLAALVYGAVERPLTRWLNTRLGLANGARS